MSSQTTLHTEWRDQLRDGLRQLQTGSTKLFRDTTSFQVYSSSLVPGLLQTEGYAAAILRTVARFRRLPVDDSEAAARARVERSHIIHEPGRRFTLLIEEGVLHHQMGAADVMAEQLRFLLTADDVPAVSLGIIPKTVRDRIQWPRETFHVYDDRLVSIELISAQVQITQPSEIGLYVAAFQELGQMAVYGAEAQALIVRAIGDLR
ncbi:DUF5753 domain-containing protein [Streptomyces sp. NPDC004031]